LEAIEDAFLSTNAEHLEKIDIAQIPEHIGYLQEDCGLTYWYGPTVTIQSCLEYLHVWGGLPWVAAIGITAVIARLIAARWVIRGQRASARLRDIKPIMDPLREAYRTAMQEGNRAQQGKLAAKMRQIYSEGNVSVFDTFKPLLIQVPLSFGGFRCLRNMSDLPVPSLENESFLWLDSLTGNDPYIIPALIALLTWRTMTMNSKQVTMPSQGMSGVAQALKFIIPLISFFFCHYQLLAVQLWFLFQTLSTQIQVTALGNAGVRKFFMLGKLPDPTKKTAQPISEVDAFGYRIKPADGNMSIRGYQPPIAPPEPQQNVSVIDRSIEKVSKGFWKSDVGKAMASRGESGNKARRLDAKNKTYDDYESRRRKDQNYASAQDEPRLEEGVETTAGMKRRAPRRS
jgi:YidC/Oxa1 family membrane protein insertase